MYHFNFIANRKRVTGPKLNQTTIPIYEFTNTFITKHIPANYGDGQKFDLIYLIIQMNRQSVDEYVFLWLNWPAKPIVYSITSERYILIC